MKSESGFDTGVWRQITEELGWAAITIPEENEGLGLSFVESSIILEEMGRALYCGPYFSTVCLGINTINLAGNSEQKKRYLPQIAEGKITTTVAFTEKCGRWDPDGVELIYTKSSDGNYVLKGEKTYVPDGSSADLLIVAAREKNSCGAEGLSLFFVDPLTKGITRKALPTVDMTRKQSTITFDSVITPKENILATEGSAWQSLEKVFQLAAISLGAEQVGGAEKIMDISIQYAKERIQFGRAIGSFQAIKHKCADMLMHVETARSAAYYAAWAASHAPEEIAECASLVKAYCSDAYFKCASEAIQIHGGIGFTWEHNAHLYFKRAKSSEVFLGSPTFHRELIAKAIGI